MTHPGITRTETLPSSRVSITYCRPCGYEKRAREAAAAVQSRRKLAVELVPGAGGIFEVKVGDKTVAKRAKGHFPSSGGDRRGSDCAVRQVQRRAIASHGRLSVLSAGRLPRVDPMGGKHRRSRLGGTGGALSRSSARRQGSYRPAACFPQQRVSLLRARAGEAGCGGPGSRRRARLRLPVRHRSAPETSRPRPRESIVSRLVERSKGHRKIILYAVPGRSRSIAR